MKIIDLTGHRFGYLLIVGKAPSVSKGPVNWRYRCICGTEGIARSDNLRTEKTTSCGCKGNIRKKKIAERIDGF